MGLCGGTIIIYLGIIFTTTCIYKAVKKYGRDLVEDVVSREKLEKVENKIKENPNKYENTLFLLYFLPVVPKDFLTYIGSLLPISLKRFLIITVIARFPAVISSTIAGSSIIAKDIKTIVFGYAITYIISLMIAILFSSTTKKKSNIEEGIDK